MISMAMRTDGWLLAWRRLSAVAMLLLMVVVQLMAADQSAPPATLSIWNREIITLRASVGSVTPAERVQRIQHRLGVLDDLTKPVEAKTAIIEGVPATLLTIDGQHLLSILPDDVDADGDVDYSTLVKRTTQRLTEVFAAQVEQEQPRQILVGVLASVAATLVLILSLLVTWRIGGRIKQQIHPERFTKIPALFGIDLKPVVAWCARNAIQIPLLVLTALLGYVWLTFVFSRFAYTRPWSASLGDFLLGLGHQFAQALISAIPGLVAVAIIVVLTRIAVRASQLFFSAVEDGRLVLGWMLPETARATRRIVSVLLWLFAITVAYPYLPGSSSEAFKGVSVFAGLMLTLGSAGMVNQVMSGLVVVYSRTMRLGDVVKVGEVTGVVSDLGFLSTKVITPRHEEVTIPNAVLVGNPVTNYSRFDDGLGMLLSVTVTIGYDTPWRQVHALLELAASRTPSLRREPTPFVVQKALDDFYVHYELRARLEVDADRFATLSRLNAQIQDAFNEHGVQIMSPHFVAQPAQNVVVPKDGWSPPPARPTP